MRTVFNEKNKRFEAEQPKRTWWGRRNIFGRNVYDYQFKKLVAISVRLDVEWSDTPETLNFNGEDLEKGLAVLKNDQFYWATKTFNDGSVEWV
jgi:hypothetical protein